MALVVAFIAQEIAGTTTLAGTRAVGTAGGGDHGLWCWMLAASKAHDPKTWVAWCCCVVFGLLRMCVPVIRLAVIYALANTNSQASFLVFGRHPSSVVQLQA